MSAATRLRLAAIGYGRMGRAVAAAARERGHEVVAVVSPHALEATHRSVDSLAPGTIDVAIEFTHGSVAETVVNQLLERKLATVSGATGWNEGVERMRAVAAQQRVGFLWAPNFSLGVAVTAELAVRAAAALGALGGWSPYVFEEHHQAKRDAPSGTARLLAERIVSAMPGKTGYGLAPADAPVPRELVPVAWVRAGAIPGTHRIGFDADFETLEIVHRVRDRATFAHGAVRAAEWLVSQRAPVTLQQFVASIWDSAKESD
ncbi:MAG: dihydrodipicolinate reductase C-terminal domain-containing protein [Acidobacteriota bacterium]